MPVKESSMDPFDPANADALQLIVMNRLTLAELQRRSVVRSGTWLATSEILGGGNVRSAAFPKGRGRVRPARWKGPACPGQNTCGRRETFREKVSGLGKGGFDVCLFLCVEVVSFRPHVAREVDAYQLAPLLDADGDVAYSKIRDQGSDLLTTAVAAYEGATAG
jgi:hypothetical protein